LIATFCARLPSDSSSAAVNRAGSPSGSSAGAATTSSSKKSAVLDVHLWDAVMVAVAEEILPDGKRDKEIKRAKDAIQAGYRSAPCAAGYNSQGGWQLTV